MWQDICEEGEENEGEEDEGKQDENEDGEGVRLYWQKLQNWCSTQELLSRTLTNN